MRRFLQSVVLLLALGLSAEAASDSVPGIRSLLRSYIGREGCHTVQLGRPMIRMMAGDDISSFAGIEEVMTLQASDADCPELEAEVSRMISSDDGFEMVSSRSDGPVREQAFFKDSSSGSAFVMLSSNSGMTSVIFIFGDFDLKSVVRLPKIIK